MITTAESSRINNNNDQSFCPVFGECGGCLYRGIPYDEELGIKEDLLITLLKEAINVPFGAIEAIVPSPQNLNFSKSVR